MLGGGSERGQSGSIRAVSGSHTGSLSSWTLPASKVEPLALSCQSWVNCVTAADNASSSEPPGSAESCEESGVEVLGAAESSSKRICKSAGGGVSALTASERRPDTHQSASRGAQLACETHASASHPLADSPSRTAIRHSYWARRRGDLLSKLTLAKAPSDVQSLFVSVLEARRAGRQAIALAFALPTRRARGIVSAQALPYRMSVRASVAYLHWRQAFPRSIESEYTGAFLLVCCSDGSSKVEAVIVSGEEQKDREYARRSPNGQGPCERRITLM